MVVVNGYIDPNFPDPNGPHDAKIIIYGYRPSQILAILAMVLFTLSFLAHLYQISRYRTWYLLPLVIGTAMETVGYAFRYLSSQKDPYSIIYFVVQYFFIVVAPVLYSASIYTVLTVMIKHAGRKYSPVPPKLVLGTFITSDIIATVVQVTGASLVGVRYSNQEDPASANNILLGGLAFQVFDFFLFIICLTIFLFRAREWWMESLKGFVVAMCCATTLVYLRTCFRLAETAQGLMHDLSTHEAYFGSLEFAPVVVAVIIFNIWHPGRFLSNQNVGSMTTSQV